MMNAAIAFPFARAAAALAAYERNARDAARWSHLSWFAFLLRSEPHALGLFRQALDTAKRSNIDTCSKALLRAASVIPPNFAALRTPGAALLDCLPADTGIRVLRMRAVSLRRSEARRLIEKRSRMQLSEWLGIPLDHLVSQSAQSGANAPDIGRYIARNEMPPLDRLDADALTYEGYALVMRDLRCVATPFPLLRLALPKAMPNIAWMRDSAGAIDMNGTAELFAQLPQLLPEWAWLFG